MKINVTRKIDILPETLQDKAIPNPYYTGVAVIEVNTAYQQNTGTALLQQYSGTIASDVWGRYYRRTSKDNGKIWSESSVIYEPKKTKEGVLRWNEGALFLDEEKNKILHFNNYSVFPEGLYKKEVGKSTRILMRVSSDGGETFSKPQQIIQRGCDEKNWADGVVFGKNCMHISFPAPLKCKCGKILLPVAKFPFNAGDSDSLIPCEAGCLVGKWIGEKIEWELSEMIRIDPNLSSRGLCEPTLAELSDGTILTIMRGSNSGIAHMPGYKWYSLSKDGGYSWSKPGPLLYDTEEHFFSPASGSRLIRNSGNNKLYWIGNIVPKNLSGNEPRHPLQIAEVDEEKRAIIKDTVSIIDDRQPEDAPEVQLSNFRVYEDRVTHDFILNLARICEKGGKNHSSPSYKYRIEICEVEQ